MKIGVPKEIKDNENRVGLVPGGVQKLQQHGHEILVEKDAGIGSGIQNEEYERAGAKILSTAKEVYEKAEMIVKVKEPIEPDIELLQEGQILYTFLHLAPEPELTRSLMEKKVTAIAYETIQLEDRSLPLLIPMSEVAGRMATQVGAHHLQKDQNGKGVLLSGVPGVQRARVAIIGAGTAGVNAAKVAMGMGAKVTLLDINMNRLQYIDDIWGNPISTLYSNPENLEKIIAEADLVIGTVLVPGAKAPKVVTRSMIANMAPGSVAVDIAIDQGGCFETSRPTSHAHPVYVEEGVIHYAVTNMPGAVARTSAYALTNRTLHYALKLADQGLAKAVTEDKALYKGVNVHNGKLTYKEVAEALSLPYEALKV